MFQDTVRDKGAAPMKLRKKHSALYQHNVQATRSASFSEQTVNPDFPPQR